MPNKKSMLEREQYGLGGLGKLLSPVVEKVAKSFGPDDSVKEIKTKLSVGGSFKNESIIIQGDYRDKIMEILQNKGFSVKRVGG